MKLHGSDFIFYYWLWPYKSRPHYKGSYSQCKALRKRLLLKVNYLDHSNNHGTLTLVKKITTLAILLILLKNMQVYTVSQSLGQATISWPKQRCC